MFNLNKVQLNFFNISNVIDFFLHFNYYVYNYIVYSNI